MSAHVHEHVCCVYCGLPLGRSTPLSAESDEPEYCCFGCRFAASVAGSESSAAEENNAPLRLGLAAFFAMNVMVFTMFLWSQPERPVGADAIIFNDVARYFCLMFSLPVVFLLGPTLAIDALHSLRAGRIAASLLLSVGVFAALAFSTISVIRGHGHVYFEVACVVLVSVTLGRWMESQGKARTTRSMRELQTLLPKQVRRVHPGRAAIVALEEIAIGDQLRLLAGERIPVDGIIIRGRATIDEQMLTGESVPSEKVPGEKVYSGTLNLDGELFVNATSTTGQGTLRRLIDTVMAALTEQSRHQKLVDRISAWFLPAVSVIALVTFLTKYSFAGLESSLLASLAVLVVACPCALGLATPMALWASIGRAAQRQVLFRHGDALARLAEARVICFDKTGTLTTGQLQVAQTWSAHAAEPSRVLAAVEVITNGSNHPVSKTLANYAQGLTAVPLIVTDLRERQGLGLQANSLELGPIFIGNERWLQSNGIDCTAWREACGDSNIWRDNCVSMIGFHGRIQAAFGLSEETREEAAIAVAALKKLGLEVRVLSGDRTERARRIVHPLGIQAEGDLLPDDKLKAMRLLREQYGPVIMVGDGLNDAPALAAADVGIALGCGADLSRDAASVCLLTNDLDRIAWAIELSRETSKVIRWNLFWAFFYNAVGVPMAVLGLVNPILAAVAMGVSSFTVIARSLRLLEPRRDSMFFTHRHENLESAGEFAPLILSGDAK